MTLGRARAIVVVPIGSLFKYPTPSFTTSSSGIILVRFTINDLTSFLVIERGSPFRLVAPKLPVKGVLPPIGLDALLIPGKRAVSNVVILSTIEATRCPSEFWWIFPRHFSCSPIEMLMSLEAAGDICSMSRLPEVERKGSQRSLR